MKGGREGGREEGGSEERERSILSEHVTTFIHH